MTFPASVRETRRFYSAGNIITSQLTSAVAVEFVTPPLYRFGGEKTVCFTDTKNVPRNKNQQGILHPAFVKSSERSEIVQGNEESTRRIWIAAKIRCRWDMFSRNVGHGKINKGESRVVSFVESFQNTDDDDEHDANHVIARTTKKKFSIGLT